MTARRVSRLGLLALTALFVLNGVVYAALTAPFQSPDEENHFLRAYQVSNGVVLAARDQKNVGGDVPSDLSNLAQRYRRLPFHREQKASLDEVAEGLFRARSLRTAEKELRFAYFPNTALYAPIPYLPQAAGIALARTVDASPLGALYFARLANLIAAAGFFALSAWLLRSSARLQQLMILTFFIPMAVFQMASASADGVSIGLGALSASLAFSVSKRWTERKFAALLAAAAALALCKSVYALIPLCAAPALLKRGGTERIWRTAALSIAILVPAVVWGRAASGLYVPLREGVDPHNQIRFIFEHPLAFGCALWKVFLDAPAYAGTMIGVLGWLDTPLNAGVVGFYGLCLLGLSTLKPSGDSLSRWQSLAFCLAAGATLGLVVVATYASWNAVGSRVCEGIQGRYFLPVLPLVLMGAPTLRAPPPKANKWMVTAAAVCAATATANAYWALWQRYW